VNDLWAVSKYGENAKKAILLLKCSDKISYFQKELLALNNILK